MKHWHCWTILGVTTAACVGSALALQMLQGKHPPQCNFALIVPLGFAFLVAVELAAYAAWCIYRGGLWIVRRVRRAG